MRIHLPAELSPAFPYDIAVKLVNQALLLEHRDELVGAKESVDRIMPARQCLHACEIPRQCAHDWLIVYLDITVLDGFINMSDDIRADRQFLSEVLREYAIRTASLSLDGITGRLCLVTSHTD